MSDQNDSPRMWIAKTVEVQADFDLAKIHPVAVVLTLGEIGDVKAGDQVAAPLTPAAARVIAADLLSGIAEFERAKEAPPERPN